ncbi:hypothetical protein [Paraburkholderia sp. SIMBA_030]
MNLYEITAPTTNVAIPKVNAKAAHSAIPCNKLALAISLVSRARYG